MAIYETSKDRNAEQAVAEVLAEIMDATMVKRPQFDVADYDIVRANGERVAIVEVKCRTITRATFRTYAVSKTKYDKLVALAAAGHPVALMVGWTDVIGIVKLPAPDVTFEHGGRHDRGGAGYEMMAHIPVTQFKKIKERQTC